MFDILPFPNIIGETTKEQMVQTNSYLIQLKEELEFILTNIGLDNLSPTLRTQLASLSNEIKVAVEEQDTVNQQTNNKTITVNDVLNSPAYKEDQNNIEESITATNDRITALQSSFTVNFETGELEYEIKEI